MVNEAQDPEVLKTAAQAAALAELALTTTPAREIKLSNGVVLELKPAPPYAVTEAGQHVPKPTPPIVHIESKGRDEENPNDPNYLEAMQKYEEAVYIARSDVMLLMGTSAKHIPEDVFKPEDDGWLDELAIVHVSPPVDNPRLRYLSWLKYYAFRTNPDFVKTVNAVGLLANMLSEEEVTRAVESFRSGTVGGSADVAKGTGDNSNGNHVSRPLRRASARNRRA